MARTPSSAPPSEERSVSSTDPDELRFETALAELEQIVQRMESGQLSLEDSIVAYRRGSSLLKHCQQKLDDAEARIQVLENGKLRDFDAASDGKS